VEFLRDANTTNAAGQNLYDLWASNGRAAPVEMERDSIAMSITAVEDPAEAVRPKLALLRNPFDNALEMRVDMSRPARIILRIFDVQGRRIAETDYGVRVSGSRLTWNGRDAGGREVPTGVYWAIIRAGDREWRRKIVRIK
jgi:hypothetical protein